MKWMKFLFLISVPIFILASSAFGVMETKGEINQDQPISVGELVYEGTVIFDFGIGGANVTFCHTTRFSYTYLGIEDNNIKIKYTSKLTEEQKEKGSVYDYPVEEEILTLPLDTKKQALLEIKVVSPAQEEEKLIFRVIDDAGRIEVEKFEEE